MFIRRFGPAILFSTERYESFNHVFRLASAFSNRQAPSRDTCHKFAEHDAVKHIVTGGYWKDPTTMKWVRAGDRVLEYMDKNPEQRLLIGLSTTEPKSIGKPIIICIKQFLYSFPRCNSPTNQYCGE